MDTTPGRRKPAYNRPPSGRQHPPDEDSDREEPLPDGEVEIAGTITHINAERDNWTAGRMKTRHGEVKFAGGVIGLEVGARAKLLGQFKNDPKWGRQFVVKTGSKDLPTDAEGFVELLMADERFKGIGPVRARAIIDVCDALGMELEDALETEEDRERLSHRASVPRNVIENLAEMWKKSASENQAKAQLLSLGLSTTAVNKLVRQYGVNFLVEKIKVDPYFLYREVDGFGFKKADAIAARQGMKKTAKPRILAGILAAVDESLQDGHTWTLRSEVLKRAWKILGLKSDEEKDKSRDLLNELEDAKTNDYGLAFGELDEKRVLARAAVMRKEVDLLTRLAPQPTTIQWPAIELNPALNEKQREAVLAALAHTRIVITGPAGVGKTFLVGQIIKAYEAAGLQTAVCAPTGKAAKRLEETFAKQGDQRSAYTIHRLLAYGFNPATKFKGFQYNSINLHPADLVVCDEASMLDVSLAWHLTDALKPGATLVLVGDHNQIPPVGAGAVLRDLVKTKLCPVAELTEVVRQAGVLRQNSLRILKGQLSPTAAPEKETGVSPWVVADKLGRPSECVKTVLTLMEKRLDKYGADALLNTQILAPQRKGPIGIETLNVELQKLVQSKLYGVHVEDGNMRLLVGDKVMATQNDYELGLMNGDQGIVEAEEKDNIIMALGTGELAHRVAVPKKQTGGIALAYAITVHKAQGSEWDFVIGVCHRTNVYMWHRNLLYTLVTRGAKGTCVLGDQSGIRLAVRKVDAQARRTMLSRATPNTAVTHLGPEAPPPPP